MKTKALIIVAHGSRKEASNQEVIALGNAVRDLQKNVYAVVETSFLEFASPTLEESIHSAMKRGMTEIIVLPYFLAAGKHVTHDIPDIIADIRSHSPQITITLKEHIGSSSAMAGLIADVTN